MAQDEIGGAIVGLFSYKIGDVLFERLFGSSPASGDNNADATEKTQNPGG